MLIPPLALLTLLGVKAAGSGKPGLAWANGAHVPSLGFEHPNTTISSYYTWSPFPVTSTRHIAAPRFDFIPMLWGCNASYVDPFVLAADANFSNTRLTRDRAVLAFNEPDITGQADCTPADAARTWITVVEPLKAKGYRLGSPAVAGGDVGRKWLRDWFSACQGGCHPDFLAMHWYDTTLENLQGALQDMHDEHGLPIWLTEFAVQDFTVANPAPASQPEIWAFMNASMAWLDATAWVERYFWFGAMYDMQGVNPDNTLFLADDARRRTGVLNDLGVLYAGSNGSMTSGAVACSVRGGWLVAAVVAAVSLL